MKIYYEEQLTAEEQKNLLKRPAQVGAVDLESIQRLCRDVKEQGDRAVRNYSQRFDSTVPDTFRVPQEEIDAAAKSISPEFRKALGQAATNIRKFHALQLRSTQQVETIAGVRCWREVRPLETIGLYVPAGSAPLPSTVLMLGIPAQLAQCKRVILSSPPRTNGKVDPFVLAAAQFIGITEIYCVGGAQAIAAMAYGTESIPKVDKIFGPGNKYVAAAKQIVSNDSDG
ncbi:MAG: histidinol dehydrogenase, partial [Bacteroidetes bacterium]|nr:histidinol dehydrogenase [Bacteroidota bacterium]